MKEQKLNKEQNSALHKTDVSYSEFLEKEDNFNMDKAMSEYFEAEKKRKNEFQK